MYPYVKRMFDLFLSITILIVLSPLFLVVALLIKMDSKGPVFFKQERAGQHKKPFTIYKFRTMTVESPKFMPTAKFEQPEHYITRVGKILRKTSIDELPQLFNIVKGEMSIIGPRPVIFAEVQLITERDKQDIYRALPGVTGLAQINGRDDMGISEKVEFDSEYVQRESFLFDLKILMSTVAYVLKMDGIIEGIMELPDNTGDWSQPKYKILLLGNSEIVIYNFRLELVERLLADGHEVIISSPPGEKIKKLVEMGCLHEDIKMNRRGKNPFAELKLLRQYYHLVKKVKPDIIFSYTIKPNMYGAMAAKKYRVPFVSNVTGLGSAIENAGILQKITIQMYKIALSQVQTIFFQNIKNRQFFTKHNIVVDRHALLPGSGVNLDYYHLLDYPVASDTIDFVFISRIMKEKGIDEYLETAKYIKKKYPNTQFHIAGFFEEEYEERIMDYQEQGIVIYHGMLADIRELLVKTHCTILPSYHEGMSNVLLESAACGRPVLASNIHGCKEAFDEGSSGYCFEPQNVKSLIAATEQFLTHPLDEMKAMGLAGRKKMEGHFDRQIVVNNYLLELDKLVEKVLEVQ